MTASDFDNLAGLIDDEQIAKLKNHEKSKIGDVTISQEDSEKSSKIYTTPNHNIISAITKVLQKIRPIEAFIRDDRPVMNTTSGPLVPQVKFSTQFTNLAAYS